MAKSLRQRLDDLQAENEELREVIEDYEDRFDAIAQQVPEEDESEEEQD
jgi:cell division protein FtsB